MGSGSNTGRGKVMISDIVFRENFVYSIKWYKPKKVIGV